MKRKISRLGRAEKKYFLEMKHNYERMHKINITGLAYLPPLLSTQQTTVRTLRDGVRCLGNISSHSLGHKHKRALLVH